MNRRARAATVLSLLLAAGRAAAHSPTPEALLAALGAADARAALGIERVERDRTNPRVLVLRVGPRWFALDAADRLAQARRWRDEWRRAVPQGVVAVLDARSDAPVVGFGRGGAVFLRPVAARTR